MTAFEVGDTVIFNTLSYLFWDRWLRYVSMNRTYQVIQIQTAEDNPDKVTHVRVEDDGQYLLWFPVEVVTRLKERKMNKHANRFAVKDEIVFISTDTSLWVWLKYVTPGKKYKV